jgi:hypothetical protein
VTGRAMRASLSLCAIWAPPTRTLVHASCTLTFSRRSHGCGKGCCGQGLRAALNLERCTAACVLLQPLCCQQSSMPGSAPGTMPGGAGSTWCAAPAQHGSCAPWPSLVYQEGSDACVCFDEGAAMRRWGCCVLGEGDKQSGWQLPSLGPGQQAAGKQEKKQQ